MRTCLLADLLDLIVKVNTRVKSKQLLEILLDLQVWLLVFMTISVSQ